MPRTVYPRNWSRDTIRDGDDSWATRTPRGRAPIVARTHRVRKGLAPRELPVDRPRAPPDQRSDVRPGRLAVRPAAEAAVRASLIEFRGPTVRGTMPGEGTDDSFGR